MLFRSIGDFGCYSFNGNKIITTGGGGAITANSTKTIAHLRYLSTQAKNDPHYYIHDEIGYNYRMTNIQAAVGCAQLERLEEFVEKKREIRAFYNKECSGIEKLSLFQNTDYGNSACWFSGIVLKQGGLGDIRNLCGKLREKEIEARSFWKPVHLQKPYEKALKADNLDASSGLWDRILTLQCSTNITMEELKYVAKTVKEVLEK